MKAEAAGVPVPSIGPVAQGAQNQVIPEALAYLVGQLQGAGLQAEAEGLEDKLAEIARGLRSRRPALVPHRQGEQLAQARAVAPLVQKRG